MKELNEEAIAKLRIRYAHVQPLIFRRTVEKSRGIPDFFDIMESMPDPPVSWNEESRAWVKDTDLLGSKKLKKK